MERKPTMNGHSGPVSHQEETPGSASFLQDRARKPKEASAEPMEASAEPMEASGKPTEASAEPTEATGPIAGVLVEPSKTIMSFYQATREHLLSLEAALGLLEAQAATGSVVDPVAGREVSVAEAVQLGLVGLELKEKLLSAERAAKGFVDPYSEEKICLYQAMRKELVGWEQGMRLMEAQVATGGVIEPATGQRLPAEVACERGCLDEEMREVLSEADDEAGERFLHPATLEKVSYQELRRRCVVEPSSGLLLLPLPVTFEGLGGRRVSARDLLDCGIITFHVFRELEEGRASAQEVAEKDSVRRFLRGTRSVAGVLLPSGEPRSLYRALREHLLVPGAALTLLQVQAATGGLVDPVRNKTYSVDEAVSLGLVGPELYEKLASAEKTFAGYKDPCSGQTLSLFQAVQKGFVPKDHGLVLLEAQLATGGVVAPGRHLRVPSEKACELGYLDEATRRLLSGPNEATERFSAPGSEERLSYAELLRRCLTDPTTGLLLLPLAADGTEKPERSQPFFFFDRKTQEALEAARVAVEVGKFQGKSVPLWDLLFSDLIPGDRRAHLAQKYLSGSLSVQELGREVGAAVREATSTAKATFQGLRQRVTADQLLSSEIISRDLFRKLKEGETSAREVVAMDTVQKYLRGTGSIGGLLLPDSQEKISVYQAKRKGLLRPGTALILLEAQAATGFVVDPTSNRGYSVDEALRANVIGPEVYDKLLAAEKAVTGYTDPASGQKISLFQAMRKELIVKEHAIRLLEAQLATGGIVDPVGGHRIPVEVAYRRGYFDQALNLILSDPGDDTKGFFDPNTEENLTYLQLKERCITEASTGLCLLPLNSRKNRLVDEATRRLFQSSWLPVRFGRLKGEKVSVWELLNSEYFSEGRRREILNHYRLRKLTLEQIRRLLEEEAKKWAPVRFPALRGSVSAYQLMETGVIDRPLLDKLLDGSVTPEEVLRMDSVRRYLHGSGSIGGVILQPSRQRLSIYEAMKRRLMVPGVALPLLEAQAATGFLIDPVAEQKLRVDEAVREGVVGPEVHEKLRRAEEAVTGYKDPFAGGKKIPLFQAMKKGLVGERQALRLLEVQVATGGVVDPACGHHVPAEAARRRGCLDEETSQVLLEPGGHHPRAFCHPESHEPLSYAELIQRCERDEASGFHLLPLAQAAAPPGYGDEEIRRIFQETAVMERGVSLWELLHAGYLTEEQRHELLERFRTGKATLEELVALALGLVKEMEMKARTHLTLEGLRGGVSAVWLAEVGVIPQEIFEELARGVRSPEEVAEMEDVKKYLQGTGNVAGVLLEASKEKLSIYEAMKRNFLLPGVALRLLEAQAATGYLPEVASGRRLGVREAAKAGVVGEELSEKLLSAERAATGYPDPYTGGVISLGQALQKELVAPGDAVPLLEAQLATGGVIDPIHGHHLPLQAASRLGFYHEELHRALSQPDGGGAKVFFDPNAKENVTYGQLKERCVRDAQTGLWLLPLSEDAAFGVDELTLEALRSATVCVNVGRFKGQTVSAWDLLESEYVSESKRKELVRRYQEENAAALEETVTSVTSSVREAESRGKNLAFKGLRKRVSASDLFQSQLIDKKTLEELHGGTKTVEEVTEMDSVRRYLEGGNFIAGVLLQPSREKMSIYQAMRRGLLRPGTALVLLEAQAATGYVIDPVSNSKFSVEEALGQGLIGHEVFEKLLCAERAVTGYTDPYTKAPMSLFEAMKRGLIVRSHGLRLLEAQVATGGIIDPVHSHRVPVQVAYERGYFDEEMNRVLQDPGDDTKGFFDPNTHENLTYLQLLERCVRDPQTGLHLLQVVQEGGRYFYIDEATKQVLRSQTLEAPLGRFKGRKVSVWDVLCSSSYVSEEQKKSLVMRLKSKTLTLGELVAHLLQIIEETERKGEALKVPGLRGDVSVAELFAAEIIDKRTLEQVQDGSLTLGDLAKRDEVRRYLWGTGCIAGIFLPSRNEKMSISQALEKGFLTEPCALGLLEAQAATGFLLDPLGDAKLNADEAVASGLVGEDFHAKLSLAEKALTGFADPTGGGGTVSLFQAVKRKVVPKELGLRLLEAQLATGGIVDPVGGHRVPPEAAKRRGCLDEETFLLLSHPEHGTKGFVDPNTQEKLSYRQLLQRCLRDGDNYLLQVMEKEGDYFYIDERTKKVLAATQVRGPVGRYKGVTVSLWELLCSEYMTEERRKELVKRYKDENHRILQGIIQTLLDIIKEKEKARSDVWFQGLRQQITASELLSARIITEETLEKLHEGKESAQAVAQMEDVRRYLEGTGCIAGILVPSKANPGQTEKMSIYQAMWKGILRQGTALVLLEAQAATGFLVDPVANRKLSVAEAVAAGLVGAELQQKLLSAERAVTGYRDPYTGQKISLFQAMKSELIVKEHGLRLLEAQVATGGIIDPVHSHRVPVEVAYQRGYFDEEMNRVLSDPGDDTKGFFDPNTHENLTYLQLLRRCLPDPETGLLMLQLMDKTSVLFQLNDDARQALQAARVTLRAGTFQGQSVSLWEVLFSSSVPEIQRQDLLRRYKTGTVAIEEVAKLLEAIVAKAEGHGGDLKHDEKMEKMIQAPGKNGEGGNSEKDQELERSLKSQTMKVPPGSGFQSTQVSLWEVLFSHHVPQSWCQDLLDRYKMGTISISEMIQILTLIVTEGLELVLKHEKMIQASTKNGEAGHSEQDQELERSLKSQTMKVPPGSGFQSTEISLWEVLFSHHVPQSWRQDLLDRYKMGTISISEMIQILTLVVTEGLELVLKGEKMEKIQPSATSGEAGNSEKDQEVEQDLQKFLKSQTMKVPAGSGFQSTQVSLWEVLFSHHIPQAKRQELLGDLRVGNLAPSALAPLLEVLVGQWLERSHRVKFSGLRRQVSGHDLLASGILDQETLAQLVEGSKTVQEVTHSDGVRRYLEGTGCVAGVSVASKANPGQTEKMSIYQAMWKGILRQGTALVLLEAQAATGFLVDPVANRKLSVAEAVAAGLVGPELQEKLLSAERAVTGYRDPYTGQKISLFQAMKSELIVKEHGLRLLEAQVATGGIIDPVHSHRVPVEVAYERGYFDEDMNRVLSDPGDDTKGFFDPNTHENLTYLQLLRRCLPDPDTGLYLLNVVRD